MRYNNIIYILSAVALMASACSKVVPDEVATRSIIGFNTVSTSTKAVTSKYPEDAPFRSTAFSYSGTWAANNSSATSYFNEELVKYNSTYSYWITYDDTDTEKAYSWPGGTTKLTFFSYSPSTLKGTATVTTNGVRISSWDVTSNTGDILVADIAEDKTKNESLAGYTGVPTLFRQKLSKIVFRFGISSEAEAGTQVKVTSISVKDVYSAGSYSRGGYSDDKWTPSTLQADWKLYTNVSGLELNGSLSDDLSFNMIPQRLVASASAHPVLEIGYDISPDGKNWESKTASCYFDENLRQEAWEKGKKYTYTIYIGVGQYPIEFEGSVSDWGKADQGTINIGG
ncbi:MAG: hypothetical protein ACI4AE_01200 [Candidatus Cryptobacteroides sp.]